MKKCLTILFIIFICAAFSACSKKVVKTETGETSATQTSEKAQQPESQPSATPSETMPSEEKTVQAERPKEAVPEAKPEMKGLQDIFFDFDRFSIREDARPALEDNSKYFKANANIRVTIEGHCDERGTSEYNIALGERRAQAAKKYLVDLGMDASRISIISYGKEKPFCAEHNEECWQENRRAHFVVK